MGYHYIRFLAVYPLFFGKKWCRTTSKIPLNCTPYRTPYTDASFWVFIF